MNVRKDGDQSVEVVAKPLFEFSTQFRYWRFSESGLQKARQELNEGAVSRVKSKLEEERNVDLPTSTNDGLIEPNKVEYLTVSDELELLTFYLSKISQLCRASFFKFPETVEATAMTYLKRFYLRNTCMDYHPKNIMLTCLFLATKTENVSISIDNFASRIPKTTNDDVLSLEFLVAQSLRFQFKVHHPHLAARGIYLDLQQCFLEAMDLNLLSNSWSKVSSLLRSARLTDLEFLWAPSQIAAAAWWAVDKTLTENWLLKKSDRKNLSQLPSLSIESLTSHLSSISKVFLRAQEAPINKDRVTAVDRRLRFCRNPEKDPNSSLYKLKQAEIENESLSKHREKYSKEKAQDPFA